MNNTNLIPVVYIGHKERKTDNVAGSGAVWHGHGDVQPVTPQQWGLLSKYPQIWARDVDMEAIKPLVTEAASLGARGLLGDLIPGGNLAGANEQTPVIGVIPRSPLELDGAILYGTDVLPAHVEINGAMVQLGTVVSSAHAASGLSVEDWNGLVPKVRDQLLIEHLEVMRAGAASGTPAQAAAPTGEVSAPVDSTPAPKAPESPATTTEASKPKAPAAGRQRRQAAAPTGEVS